MVSTVYRFYDFTILSISVIALRAYNNYSKNPKRKFNS